MPLSTVLGIGVPSLVNVGDFSPKLRPEDVALIGVRSLDSGERDLIKSSGINVFTMRDIDQIGIHKVMGKALEVVLAHTDGLHLSLDMDFVDPSFAPGVGTPCAGGPTYREAHLAMEMVADTKRLSSMDVVEINPIFDERNRTSVMAIELVLSALGQRIY
jgi:arginase